MRMGRVLLSAAVLLAPFVLVASARAADTEKPKAGTASGLIIEKDNKKMKVVVDGQSEETTFLLPVTASPALVKEWNKLFNVSRVRLSYKMNGDDREVTGLTRQVGLPRATVTGTVVKVYLNGFWISVKLKNGPLDGFAQTFPCPQAVKDTMKNLEKGDVVTIQYYTDFERHRITGIRKIKSAKPSKDKPDNQ